MYLPGNTARFEGADARGRHALQFYSDLWMPYAFPILTMADGPDTGMEYPMFIMSALGAEDHEIGHEWWPMMVGTNETWYGFMDEGFNQYMNILSSAARRGVEPLIDGRGQSYGGMSGNEREGPLMWNANYGGPNYGFQAYSKAPLMLSMLGGVVGDDEVTRAMSEYAEAWRFKHPSPWDYMFFMNESLGQDLGWFWNYWLFTTESVDGSISDVVANGSATTVTVRQDGQMPSPVVLQIKLRAGAPAVDDMPNVVSVGEGEFVVTYPVDVWFAGSKTFDAELPFALGQIESIVLDPGGRFPDRDPGDNAWPSVPAGR
jgi:Peptidase family M1 domain